MKKIIILLSSVLFIQLNYAQNVGIGTNAPNASAQLDVTSTTKGMLVPRMTTAQRNGIPSPAKGLIVYDSTSNSYWYHNGSSWNNLITSGTGWTLNGNFGTNPSTHFIGTADNNSLLFKVNNQRAGFLGTMNNGNVFWGYQSGVGNYGYSNIGIGAGALFNNSWNSNLIAIGDSALYKVSFFNAGWNTAIGSKALFANSTGYANTAIGFHAMDSNTVGHDNTAVGYSCLFSNLSGYYNSSIGEAAMYYNTTGHNNVANGYQSLAFNTTGSYNTSSGSYAIPTNYGGNYNTGIGYGALWQNQGGSYNSAFGDSSLYTNFSGFSNTGIGYRANVGQDYLSNATAIGANSRVDCSNCMVLGSVNGINGATSNVNIGIGQTNPGFPLNFASALGDKISLWGNSGAHYGFGIQSNQFQIHTDIPTSDILFGYGSSGLFTENMRIKGNGNVGIGSNAPTQKLYVAGNICATGSIGSCSDVRYKKNILLLTGILNRVLGLQAISYDWNRDKFPDKAFSDKRQIGFSAQDLEKIFPEVVQTDTEGYKSVDYARLTPLLVEGMKEQQTEISNLKSELTEMKKMIADLYHRLENK